jgi:DNA-binding response OmpR family regulator
MSGYTEDPGLLGIDFRKGNSFLQKPFSPLELISKVRRTLEKIA